MLKALIEKTLSDWGSLSRYRKQKTAKFFNEDFSEKLEVIISWKEFTEEYHLEELNLEIGDVIARLQKFFKPVFDAIVNETEFNYEWHPRELKWKPT